MGSFVAYKQLKPTALRRIAKESINGIQKWFKNNPKRNVCHASLWYGIERDFKPKDNISVIINKLLEDTLKRDAEIEKKEKIKKERFHAQSEQKHSSKKEKKKKNHVYKYKIGDIVGVVTNCMSEFEITGFEKNTKLGFGYKAKCLLLHLSNPEESEIKIGQEYFVKEEQIVLKLR